MAIIKSYADLEQSKKLAKFLPLETADMFYALEGVVAVASPYIEENLIPGDPTAIPCWSLTGLLSVLPDDCCGIDKENGKYAASYVVSNDGGTYISDNSVDACMTIIERLHELNLL